MKSNILSLAQSFERERNWKKASECYKQYIKESERSCEEAIYVSYARCLRMIGQTTKAKELLHIAKRRYPQSERILVEYYDLCDFLGDWNAGRAIAKTLIRMNPKHADYYFRLGRSYSFLLEFRKAKRIFITGLEHKHGLSSLELLEKIQKGFAENPANVSSKYIYIDGKNNLGAFIHEYEGRKYFTKISIYRNKNIGAGREEAFYKNLCADFRQLKNFTPEYFDSQIIDQISYLTIEMIDSRHPTSGYFKKIIETSQKISTVTYHHLLNNYPIPNYVFQFKKGRGVSVVHFFTQIHEKAYNQKLFESLHLIIKQHGYPKSVSQIIDRLESAIMENQLYRFIKPEKHYTLLHGDFAFQNIVMNKNEETPIIIDWTSYTVGPHFIDIGRYMTSLQIPYSEVKEIYIHDNQTGGKLTLIEQIFFLYALIIFYFQKIGRKGIETELSVFLLPALEDLEKLVEKFKTSIEGDCMIEGKQDSLAENELKIKQLEQRILILEEERKYLHQRLENMLKSKSWKITMPLRVFTERQKKRV